jgi:putative PIG3 family NAD(P)H quinone oxidoreductase
MTLPDQMTHVTLKENRLCLTKGPLPVPSADEYLIKVKAAGINRPDLLQRQGLYPPPKGASDILGLEVAGEIMMAPPHAPYQKGDYIAGLITGGGYAAYAAVPLDTALPYLDGFDDVHMAALPEVFFTVYKNIIQLGRLQKGEKILIHGGSSGIGTVAIQMAKAYGAFVVVTAGSAEKCSACLNLGADLAINYKTADFAQMMTAQHIKVDLVLDMVGGVYVDKNISVMNAFGRHISIATQLGKNATINIGAVMQKQLSLTGSTLRARPLFEKKMLRDGIVRDIYPLLAQGQMKPIIDRVFVLEDAESAHQYMLSSQHIGKIILKVQ